MTKKSEKKNSKASKVTKSKDDAKPTKLEIKNSIFSNLLSKSLTLLGEKNYLFSYNTCDILFIYENLYI